MGEIDCSHLGVGGRSRMFGATGSTVNPRSVRKGWLDFNFEGHAVQTGARTFAFSCYCIYFTLQ